SIHLLRPSRPTLFPYTTLFRSRDVGKYVTVNQMLARESVRARIDSEHGISYTEFSYMLLQAFDYWWLYTHHGCELQIGGSDQWGDRKSTRLNSSHVAISYAVFC